MRPTRRQVLQAGAATAAGMILPNAMATDVPPQKQKFKLNYAPHFGMFSNHAKSDVDQLKFAADEGFRAWEDNGMRGRSVADQELLSRTMQQLDIRMGIFVAHGIDWSNPTLTSGNTEIQDKFLADIKSSVEIQKRMNAKWVTTVLGRLSPNMPLGYQIANVVEALRRACDICEPSGMVMVVEPLNWRDHPGMYGATSDILFATCRAVNHPSCKILQDLYHLQVTEGNLIDHMNRCWSEIAYFQTGDNPGRQEPGTGEVNYANVMRHIHSKGYTGILGMEHGKSKPGKEGERALIDAYRKVDVF